MTRGAGTFPTRESGSALDPSDQRRHRSWRKQEGAPMALSKLNHWQRACAVMGVVVFLVASDGRAARRRHRRRRVTGRGGLELDEQRLGFGFRIGAAVGGGEGAGRAIARPCLRPARGLDLGRRCGHEPHLTLVEAAGWVRRRAFTRSEDRADQAQQPQLRVRGPYGCGRGQRLGLPHRGGRPGRIPGDVQRQDPRLHEQDRRPGSAGERAERGRLGRHGRHRQHRKAGGRIVSAAGRPATP